MLHVPKRLQSLLGPADPNRELKGKLRLGISMADRKGVWMNLAMRFGELDDRLQHTVRYRAALNAAFGSEEVVVIAEGASPSLPHPPPLHWVPNFGGESLSETFAQAHDLSPRELAVVSRVLCTLSYKTCREDCPPLPDVVGLLSHVLPEPFVFAAAMSLLENGALLEWDPSTPSVAGGLRRSLRPAVRTTRRLLERSLLAAFADLAALRCSACARHFRALGSHIEHVCRPWFSRLFVGALPYATAMRVFDCFLLEGAKVLFRVGIALLQRHQSALLACLSERELSEVLRARALAETDPGALMAHAFGLHSFRQKTIVEMQRAQLRACHAPAEEECEPPSFARAASSFFIPRLVASHHELLATLDVGLRRLLWAQLPPSERGKDGVLVYCNLAHGSSLRRLYELCAKAGASAHPALVVVRAVNSRALFGAFSSHGVRSSLAEPYGTGECFLFEASNDLVGAGVRVSSWSKRNEIFAHGDATYWAMGGGSTGGYALRLDQDVCCGSSARCETFGSERSLHERGDEHFTIHTVEVWTFQ